ncbi:MAG: HAMP domain-containing histidine kinase, partial [Chitinophagales bacterium]|nr:HAMP domain-containing histidine kinase [Chitinophagales bacterium]
MKKYFIPIIIILLALSVGGAIVMQALWINNAWQSKREVFDSNVKDALTKVAERLEKQETASFLSQHFAFGMQPNIVVSNGPQHSDSQWVSYSGKTTTPTRFHYESIYDIFDTLYKQTEVFLVSDSGHDAYTEIDTEHTTITQFKVDANGNKISQKVNIKSKQLNEVFNQMVMEWNMNTVPIQQRLQIVSLHAMIDEELKKKGITVPFQYGVVSGDNYTSCAIQSPQFSPSMIPSSFSSSLFPNDITFRPDRLLVFFDDLRPYFIRSLLWMIVLSAILSLIFIGTFSTVIYVILKQKKLSEIKTDFINNMTHEFKTPIATISVAVDSIINPIVLGNQERVKYYSELIGRENKRMNSQVEHILQMALLDKENLDLNEQLINVHNLINQVADPVRLQIENRGGKLNLDLKAEDPFVFADEIHLTNVIYNLLDNANKYSPDAPEITVKTFCENNKIVISFTDHGIGMSAATQRRIFERFYREQQGNLHNVKGFGLGLAYVKSIIK